MARKLALLALLAAAAACVGPAAAAASMEDDLKHKVDGVLGEALSAKEAAKAALEGKELVLRSKAEVGYPFDLYEGCIRTAAEWKAAFDDGVVKCVAPWLFFRAPDSPADVADPTAAATYIKGPDVALAFAAPGPGTVTVLKASKACKEKNPPCNPQDLLKAILHVFEISPSAFGDKRIVLKIFGSDASIFMGSNKGVTSVVPTWPALFDAITLKYDLPPALLGVGPLAELVSAYTTSPSTMDAYEAITGCTTTQPSCGDLTADANPKCEEYAAALRAFCKPDGSQNYDTQACVNTLATLPTDGKGAVSAVAARAFFTACIDTYFLFTANGFAGNPLEGASREFVLTGNAKLAQTGGYELIYLN